MKKNISPAFSFYPKDFVSSPKVQAMTAAEAGAYLFLLCAAWVGEPQGHLPDDDELLRRIARMSPDEWQRSRALILSCFEPDGHGRIFNPRLLRERCRQEAHSAAQRANSQKRWQCDGNATAMPRQCGGNAESCLPSPSPSPRTLNPPTPLTKGECDGIAVAEKEVVDAWNALGRPFGKVQHLGNGTRRGYLKARLLDPWWREHWREALAKLATIPGMRGQNDRGTPVDFLFFVRADSVAKIVEGKYDTWGKSIPSKGSRVSELNQPGKFDGVIGA